MNLVVCMISNIALEIPEKQNELRSWYSRPDASDWSMTD